MPDFFAYAQSPCLFISIALLLLLSCDAAVSSKFIDALDRAVSNPVAAVSFHNLCYLMMLFLVAHSKAISTLRLPIDNRYS
jgi:hypothetical protein